MWYHWLERHGREQPDSIHYRAFQPSTPVDITQETPKQKTIIRDNNLLDIKSIPLANISKDF
jgi:hypothetical protein